MLSGDWSTRRMAGHGRYVEVYIAATMHSLKLCTGRIRAGAVLPMWKLVKAPIVLRIVSVVSRLRAAHARSQSIRTGFADQRRHERLLIDVDGARGARILAFARVRRICRRHGTMYGCPEHHPSSMGAGRTPRPRAYENYVQVLSTEFRPSPCQSVSAEPKWP